MSSNHIGTRYCVCRPQQICPPAQYIQGIVSAVHNKYVYWAGGHICCGLQTKDFVLQGWRTYLLWPAATIPCTYWAGWHTCSGLQTQYLVDTGLEDIFVMACRDNTLYIHYYLSPLCGEFLWLEIVHRSTCIHTLTGTRYLKVESQNTHSADTTPCMLL